jgi:DNA (cytosine-5)-methyltransferase 1
MHLFAGVGGGILADLILGHIPIVAVEWDKYACKVLRERVADGWFDGMSVWEGDVQLFDPSEYKGRVDCIHAGFPCQDISTAGNQAGIGENSRSGGYDAVWICLSAAEVGAWHKRDRWWLLGYTDSSKQSVSLNEGFTKGSQKIASKGAESSSSTDGISDVPDTNSERRCGWNTEWTNAKTISELHRGERRDARRMGFWDIESNVGRVANGIPNKTHRLKGLGNAQVPLQAATAFSLLWEIKNDKNTITK